MARVKKVLEATTPSDLETFNPGDAKDQTRQVVKFVIFFPSDVRPDLIIRRDIDGQTGEVIMFRFWPLGMAVARLESEVLLDLATMSTYNRKIIDQYDLSQDNRPDRVKGNDVVF